MQPQYIASRGAFNPEFEAFWPQPADMVRDQCLLFWGCAILRTGCAQAACNSVWVVYSTPNKIRRDGCQRASRPFWLLDLSHWLLRVLSKKKKLFLLKSQLWLNQYPTNTNLRPEWAHAPTPPSRFNKFLKRHFLKLTGFFNAGFKLQKQKRRQFQTIIKAFRVSVYSAIRQQLGSAVHAGVHAC